MILKRIAMALCFLSATPGVECENVRINAIISGHAVLAECQLSGVTVQMPVRLLYVVAPEPGTVADAKAIQTAKDILAIHIDLRDKHARYALWAPGDTWKYDEYGRLMAVVFYGPYYRDLKMKPKDAETLVPFNVNVLAAGVARIQSKHGEIGDFPGLKLKLMVAEEMAMKAKDGFWSNPPEWFFNKVEGERR